MVLIGYILSVDGSLQGFKSGTYLVLSVITLLLFPFYANNQRCNWVLLFVLALFQVGDSLLVKAFCCGTYLVLLIFTCSFIFYFMSLCVFFSISELILVFLTIKFNFYISFHLIINYLKQSLSCLFFLLKVNKSKQYVMFCQ